MIKITGLWQIYLQYCYYFQQTRWGQQLLSCQGCGKSSSESDGTDSCMPKGSQAITQHGCDRMIVKNRPKTKTTSNQRQSALIKTSLMASWLIASNPLLVYIRSRCMPRVYYSKPMKNQQIAQFICNQTEITSP